MAKLWLPPTAHSEARRLGWKKVERIHPSLAKTEEETFEVGGSPVYIPGASRLDGSQLEEILDWQEERNKEDFARQKEREEASKKVRPEQFEELRQALAERVEWEEKREQGVSKSRKGTQYF